MAKRLSLWYHICISTYTKHLGRLSAAFRSSGGLFFALTLFFVLLGSFIRPQDSDLLIVERKHGFSYGGPISQSLPLQEFQGAFSSIPESSDSSVLGVSLSAADFSGAVFANRAPVSRGGGSLRSSFIYEVRSGDVLSTIALRFDVSQAIIREANPALGKTLKVGQKIVIPPAFEEDSAALAASLIALKNQESEDSVFQVVSKVSDLPVLSDYFVQPAKGWNWGELHEENGVDIAHVCGSPVYAAASGIVIEESSRGFWNKGYGNYLLIEHSNGVRTRYAHTLRNIASIGDKVSQGDEVALMGNTGNVSGPTGCHLHFEVIGAQNPFTK